MIEHGAAKRLCGTQVPRGPNGLANVALERQVYKPM